MNDHIMMTLLHLIDANRAIGDEMWIDRMIPAHGMSGGGAPQCHNFYGLHESGSLQSVDHSLPGAEGHLAILNRGVYIGVSDE